LVAEELRPAVGGGGADRSAAVAEAETHLVVAAQAFAEVPEVEARHVPLVRALKEGRRADRVVGLKIDRPVLVPPASGDEAVPPAVERVLDVQEQIRAEDVALFELVEPMGSTAGVGIALVQEERVVLDAGKPRLEAVLGLLAQEEGEGDDVLRAGLPVELGVPVRQVGVDGRLGTAEESDHADVLAAESAPEPELVLEDRPSQLGAVIGDLADVVGLVAVASVREEEALVTQEGWGQVRPLEIVVGQESAGGAVEAVRTTLGREADVDTARLLGDVASSRGHVDLLEGVEVEVGGRAAAVAGDADAVEDEGVVGEVGALAVEGHLIVVPVPGDVYPIQDHARDRPEQGP